MNVVFRADASSEIGSGHVMRCLQLAKYLRGRDASVRFVSRSRPGDYAKLVRAMGIDVSVISPPHDQARAEEADAAETLRALEARPDWIVVDSYELGSAWEREAAKGAERLMVVDDLASQRHECDLLLNQNFSKAAEGYHGLVPSRCKILAGPRYALLDERYHLAHKSTPSRNGEIKRLLIFFGGTDEHNLTGRALEAVSAPEFADIEVDVVIGANNPHREELDRQANGRARTTIRGHQDTLIPLLSSADAAIGAGGATTWERMCMGVPAIVVSVADNQLPSCEALAAHGLIAFIGKSAEVQAGDIARELRRWIADAPFVAAMSRAGRFLVDGLGAARVGEALWPSADAALSLRPATKEDITLYFQWANDPTVRQQAIHGDPISLDEHEAWFSSRIASRSAQLFVLMAGSLPVGQLRFDESGDDLVISYSLDELVRGRGWGKKLVALALEKVAGRGRPIRAEVKAGNAASLRVFESLGFNRLTTTEAGPGFVGFALGSNRQ